MPGTPRPHDPTPNTFPLTGHPRKQEAWQPPQQSPIFPTRPLLNKKQNIQYRPPFYGNQIQPFDDKMVSRLLIIHCC